MVARPGRLLDYLRFVFRAPGSILLRGEPTAGAKGMIESVVFGLFYGDLGSWVVENPGGPAG